MDLNLRRWALSKQKKFSRWVAAGVPWPEWINRSGLIMVSRQANSKNLKWYQILRKSRGEEGVVDVVGSSFVRRRVDDTTGAWQYTRILTINLRRLWWSCVKFQGCSQAATPTSGDAVCMLCGGSVASMLSVYLQPWMKRLNTALQQQVSSKSRFFFWYLHVAGEWRLINYYPDYHQQVELLGRSRG